MLWFEGPEFEESLEKMPIATSAASPRDLGGKIFKARDRESREDEWRTDVSMRCPEKG